ncbi:class-II fumarase/aspartase family protein [Ferrimonas senticii]|uniref:class-II fumarase/aspartase family protein n=1 Tax=Ferrimonas senticii TaxID=394566 RepID=UPI0004130C37|nr:adenylosuccinate lyase family protein [Ferrimonas senticii]
MNKTLIAAAIAATSLFTSHAIAAPQPHSDSAVSVFDSAIYGSLFSNDEIRAIFNDDALVSYWLEVEVALAQSQAELGLIPAAAAQSIAKVAKLETIDMAALGTNTAKVGRGIKGLTDQLRKAGDANVKSYLHYGSTTQDIMDSATAMQIDAALEVSKQRLTKLILTVAAMAEAHKDTVMVARSNGQDAIPTTFGLHLSTYLSELDRHHQRLAEVQSRLTIQVGSTVGTLAPYGEQGVALQHKMADKLGLAAPLTPWNPSRDVFAETVQTVSLINATLGRLALDVNTLSRTPINEIKEGESGASSTMPQKRNPRAAEFMGAFERMGSMYNAAATQIMSHNDTRQGAPWIVEWSIIPESFMVANEAMDRAQRLFDNLIVNPEAMRANFMASDNFVMSEAVMNAMVAKIGRGAAYDMVKKAIKAAPVGTTLDQILLTDANLKQHISPEQAAQLMDPANYVGQSAAIVTNAVKVIRGRHQ